MFFRLLFYSQSHRLATYNFWARNSQLVGLQLVSRWLPNSNLLACTLVVLAILSCGFCFATLLLQFNVNQMMNRIEYFIYR